MTAVELKRKVHQVIRAVVEVEMIQAVEKVGLIQAVEEVGLIQDSSRPYDE